MTDTGSTVIVDEEINSSTKPSRKRYYKKAEQSGYST